MKALFWFVLIGTVVVLLFLWSLPKDDDDDEE